MPWAASAAQAFDPVRIEERAARAVWRRHSVILDETLSADPAGYGLVRYTACSMVLRAAYLCAFLVLGSLVLIAPYLPRHVRLADEAKACDEPGSYRVELSDVTSTIEDPFTGETICPMGFEMVFVFVAVSPGQEAPESPRCVRNRREIECGG